LGPPPHFTKCYCLPEHLAKCNLPAVVFLIFCPKDQPRPPAGQCAGTVWNVPGLFGMVWSICRDCLELNSPGTFKTVPAH